MSATGRNSADKPRDDRDYYHTPAWAVLELFANLPQKFPRPTLDPCAGTGGLLLPLLSPNHPAPRGIELDPELAKIAQGRGADVQQGDGLKQGWGRQHVILNPPYKDAMRWIRKGNEEAASVWALLNTAILGSEKRHAFWEKHPPRAIFFFSSRPSFTSDGGTDATVYAWFLWTQDPTLLRGHYETNPLVKWLLKPEWAKNAEAVAEERRCAALGKKPKKAQKRRTSSKRALPAPEGEKEPKTAPEAPCESATPRDEVKGAKEKTDEP